MIKQLPQLELGRCPHCNVAKPLLTQQWNTTTKAHSGANPRDWVVYYCHTCGGVVLTGSTHGSSGIIQEIYPRSREVDNTIPERARGYLTQALASIHAPAGAVMLTASAVDAMLKAKDYKDGSLYTRIDKAAEDHTITQEMAAWAHEVRLDANDQRHSDESANLPTENDATKVLEFALALAEFLFVLPGRVSRGRRGKST